MNADRWISIILTVVVSLITAAVPAYVAYDLWGRGSIPEKRVQLMRYSNIHPLRDLSALGDRVSIYIKVEDQTFDNLVIARAYLLNAGSSPILPSDFFENLSINVETPWKIVAVENGGFFRGVTLKWKRISDTRFEAAPALLNPGDSVPVTIYLTDTRKSGIAKTDKQAIRRSSGRLESLTFVRLTICPHNLISLLALPRPRASPWLCTTGGCYSPCYPPSCSKPFTCIFYTERVIYTAGDGHQLL